MAKGKMPLALPLLLALVLALAGCGVPQEDYDTLQAQLDSVQRELNTTKSGLAAAQNEIKNLQDELATESKQAKESIDALQEQASGLESRLNGILDTGVVKYYEIAYQGIFFNWPVSIPLRTYFHYKDQPRPVGFSEYSAIITDSSADVVMDVLVGYFQDAALSYDLRKSDIVNMVAMLTQTLPHTDNDVTTPYDGYTRYPVETLFENGGDSEDNSILAATLLARLGYNVVFFVFEEQKHMAVGVDISADGANWEHQGIRYYYLETMGIGLSGTRWQLGDTPVQYRNIRPLIVPLSD